MTTQVQSGTSTTGEHATGKDYKAKATDGRKAFKELLAPVQGRIYLGQGIAALSGVAAIWPYIVLTRLGELLLPAAHGEAIDKSAVLAQVNYSLRRCEVPRAPAAAHPQPPGAGAAELVLKPCFGKGA